MPKMISNRTASVARRRVIGNARSEHCSETGCPLNEVPKSPWKMPLM